VIRIKFLCAHSHARDGADMQVSIYLARLIGPALALAGMSMLLNPQGFLDIATGIVGDAALLYFLALSGVIGGTAIVLAHNVWVADWRVVVTIIGWASIVDSTLWLLFPRQLARLYAPILNPSLALVGGLVALIAGAALIYFGYFATHERKGRRR
jgi:hypothetical protein